MPARRFPVARVWLCLLLAPPVCGQHARVSLYADLTVRPGGRSGDRFVQARFTFGARHSWPRAYAKITVEPCVRTERGRTFWRGALASGKAEKLEVQVAFSQDGEYELAGGLFALHPEAGHIAMGTRKQVWVRVSADGVRVIEVPSLSNGVYTACSGRLPEPDRHAELISFDQPKLIEVPARTGGLRAAVRLQVQGRQGQAIFATISSKEFDPVGLLYGPSGELLAFNDDAEGWSARLPRLSMIRLYADGVYTLEVLPFVVGTGGRCEVFIASR